MTQPASRPRPWAQAIRPIFLHAPRITFQPLAFGPKPFAAIAQGHSYDQILAGELDLSHEDSSFIIHPSSFPKVPPPTTPVSPCIGGQNLSPAPVLKCLHRFTPILKETAVVITA